MSKLNRFRLSLRDVAFVICALLITGALVMSTANMRQGNATLRAQQRTDNCLQIEVVKDEIRKILERSLETIPTIDYYKTHPAERQKAIADTEFSIARFVPVDCSKTISPVGATIEAKGDGGSTHPVVK